jgi:hypothetical protein
MAPRPGTKLPPLAGELPRLPKPSGPAIFAGSKQPPDDLQKIAAALPKSYPLGPAESTRGTRHAGAGWPHGALGPPAQDHALAVSPFKPISAAQAQAAAAAAAAAAMGEAGAARRKRRQDAALDDALAAPRIVPRYGWWRVFVLVLCILDIGGSIAGWLQYRYCLAPVVGGGGDASGSWASAPAPAARRGRRLEEAGSWSGSASWGGDSSWDMSWEEDYGSSSWSGSQSGSWSALDVEEEPAARLETTVLIQGAISKDAILAELQRAIASVTNTTGGGSLTIERVVYTQTMEASLVVPGGENITQDSADGVQFRSGVAGAAGSGVTLSDVAILASRRRALAAANRELLSPVYSTAVDASHRRRVQEESAEIRFTVRSDRDLSHVVADANFIGALVESINEAASGGTLQLNASTVDFGEQPSFTTVVSYTVRADSAASAAASSEIDTLRASIESEGFSDRLAAQLADSHPGLTITVRYAGQSCAGNPCGAGGRCSESSDAATEDGGPVRVCDCQAGYSFVPTERTCAALSGASTSGVSWRSDLGDASALCWMVPPYIQLGDVVGAEVWSELWRGGVDRLQVYTAMAANDIPKVAQGQDFWMLAILRLLLLLPLRLLLDRLTRSPTPQPAQFKFILSNDHLSDEIQEILSLRRSNQKTHPFKSTGGQGGWRMVGGTLAPSRRFQTGAVGEDVHYITAATIPELQHQFHKRLQLPSKSAWPESRLRLAVLTEPENPAELKHPLDENDPAVTRTDPEEDDMAARQEPEQSPAAPLPPSHGDWAGWGMRELTTLEGLKPAPVVHRLALNVGLPYDTELAVPRRAATLRVWTAAAVLVSLVCCASLALAAVKIALLNRDMLGLGSDEEDIRARTLRLLSVASIGCTTIELSGFLGWLFWLRYNGVVPPSAEFPRPPRRCCCGKRKLASVRPEPTAVENGAPKVNAPPKGWRGLWGGVALYDWVVEQQRRLRWISCTLLLDIIVTTALFVSLGYCGGSMHDDASQSGSGSFSVAADGHEGSTGLLCWVVPPELAPPLTLQIVLEDWRAEGWGADNSQATNYEATVAQGDLLLMALARALLLLSLLAAGLQVSDAVKPRNKLLQLLCGCVFNGLLKGCGCGDGSRDESAIVGREVLKRKQQDAQGIPRWRKRRWCVLLSWCIATLFLLLIKLLMMLGWGGCGPDDKHRPNSFMEDRCETDMSMADGAGGLAFSEDTRPFDLRGAPNAMLLGGVVCTIGCLEIIGLLGMGWRLNKRPKRVVPEQDALRRTLLELINDEDDNLGAGVDANTMNDDSGAARRVARWLLALEVSGVLEDGGPALFDWMESILPKDASVVPVRYVLKEARDRITRRHRKQSEQDRMAAAKLSVEERGAALLKGEVDPGDAAGGQIGLGSGDGADAHQANHGWRWLEHTWSKYLSYHVSADRYSAPWSAAEHTVLGQLAGDRSLTWKQKAARLQELVAGAPRRSPASVKRRWVQLERLANEAGWRCAESGTYRVAGWANDATGEWMWEYPLDTAG